MVGIKQDIKNSCCRCRRC